MSSQKLLRLRTLQSALTSSANHARHLFFPGLVLLPLMLLGSTLSGLTQTAPQLIANTLELTSPNTLQFQFIADPTPNQAFQIEVSTSLNPPSLWTPSPTAQILPDHDNIYSVQIPSLAQTTFLRVVSIPGNDPVPTLFINEVMSDNTTQFQSEDRSYYDWIEIFNPNDESVNLAGYGLSDDPSDPLKWKFPERLIPSQGFLLVQASDLNKTNATEALHTNFKLKASGETLVLSAPNGTILDQVAIPALQQDQSYGRNPDGGPDLALYSKSQATPGAPNATSSQPTPLAPPSFQPQGGFHSGPVTLQLQPAQNDHSLYYTTDGSLPTLQSTRWTGTLTITQSTVIRVISANAQGQKSRPTTQTYLIRVKHDLPVISIATSPTNMDFKTGYLYGMGSAVLNSQNQVLQNYPYSGSNAWKDREVEVAIEFFEPDGSVGFRQQAGMKIYGGWGSRGYPQKSLALFARRSYGSGSFNHRIFPDQSINDFESFVLRNSGNDNQSTHQTAVRPPITEFGPTTSYGSYFVNGTFTLLRDAFMQQLLTQDTTLDTQAYRPTVVYINGDYWGIYGIREKVTEHQVVSHHNTPVGSIDLIEGYGSVRAGNATVYNQLRQLLSTRNMAVASNYNTIATQYLDIDNFIDYHLAVIYFQNFDIGNIKCWRPRIPGGKFRWLVYDQDYGFGLWPASIYVPAMARDYADYDNMFSFYTAGSGNNDAWPNGGRQTLMLRSLLANPDFKERFIIRCADLLNSSFRESKVTNTIFTMANEIRPEIQHHLERWNWTSLTNRGYGKPHQPEYQPFIPSTWESNLWVAAQFGLTRPTKLRQDCIKHFKLPKGLGTLEIQSSPPGAATILVNTLTITNAPWTGVYFADFKTTLRVIPNPGYRFESWSTSGGNNDTNTIQITVSNNTSFVAVANLTTAEPNGDRSPELILNEIQYHPGSTSDSGDWIELMNRTDQPLSTSGWVFRDEDDQHAFPLPDQLLAPGQTLVLAQDVFQFQLVYTNTARIFGSFQFGLANGGDSLRLFRPDGSQALQVDYLDKAPWPEGADGTGRTLQLLSPRSDPTSPSSWKVSDTLRGTPGAP